MAIAFVFEECPYAIKVSSSSWYRSVGSAWQYGEAVTGWGAEGTSVTFSGGFGTGGRKLGLQEA